MGVMAYSTHTGLVLDILQEDEEYVVVIIGDRTKELLRTRDEAAAKAEYAHWVSHYKERVKTEA